jgi:hypothetical protein
MSVCTHCRKFVIATESIMRIDGDLYHASCGYDAKHLRVTEAAIRRIVREEIAKSKEAK